MARGVPKSGYRKVAKPHIRKGKLVSPKKGSFPQRRK